MEKMNDDQPGCSGTNNDKLNDSSENQNPEYVIISISPEKIIYYYDTVG